jgi:hypothetical protein
MERGVSIARMVHAGSATDAVLNHDVDRKNDSGIQADESNQPAVGFKAKATTIYTWDLNHFRRLRPEVARRVQAP